MDVEKYSYIASSTKASFEFYSAGPNGKIKKVVLYQQIGNPANGAQVFNLGFGGQHEIKNTKYEK